MTDPEYETIAEPALVIPLQLDEAVGAEGLLVGQLLNELLVLPCGGSLRGEESLQVLPGLRAWSSLARTRLISSVEEVEESVSLRASYRK